MIDLIFLICKLHTGILLLQQSDLAMYVKAQRVLLFQQLNFHGLVHLYKYELQNLQLLSSVISYRTMAFQFEHSNHYHCHTHCHPTMGLIGNNHCHLVFLHHLTHNSSHSLQMLEDWDQE